MARPMHCPEGRNPHFRVDLDWNAVLAEHDRWLRRLVYWRLRDHEAVDEVMQEIALAAVRQSAPLKDPSKVAPWLYRLAIRYVLLYRRKMGRQRKLLDRYESGQRARVGDERSLDPLNWLLSDERRSLVRLALERLADRDAEILLLKYTENWSYQHIADHLGVTDAAVESRLHRARAKLRSELAGMGLVEVRR